MLKRWFQNIARLVLRGYNALYTFAFSKFNKQIERLTTAKEQAEFERNSLRDEVKQLKSVHKFELEASISTKVRVYLKNNPFAKREILELAKLSEEAVKGLPKEAVFEASDNESFERDYRDLQPHKGLSKSMLVQ